MDAVIEGFLIQLLAIDQDVPGLVKGLSTAQFNWQPARERWSIGQCIEHLNLTTERYLPVLRDAEANARAKGLLRQGPFALGFFESWFLRMMEPPPRRRIRTRRPFVAGTQLEPSRTLERFQSLNAQLGDCMRKAEGIDLKAVKVRSQFGPVSWTLNGTFLMLLAHERRHVWQARQVWKEPAFPGNVTSG
jgi:hypothetical protein